MKNNASEWSVGGGVDITDSSANITNCVINRNTAGEGGGIVTYDSSIIISNCNINENSAIGLTGNGGGAFFIESSVTMTDCTIKGNRAEQGGGMAVGDSEVTLNDCLVIGNTADYTGGVMISTSVNKPVSMSDCIISGNTATVNYAGIYNYGAELILENCIVSGNMALCEDQVAGIHLDYWPDDLPPSLTMTNCVVSGNNMIGVNTIYNATIQINNSTISDNIGIGIGSWISSSMSVENSIVSGNGDMGIFCYQVWPLNLSIKYSLFDNNTNGDVRLDDQIYRGAMEINAIDDPDTEIQNNVDGPPLFQIGPAGTWSISTAPVYDPAAHETTLTDDGASYTPGELTHRLIHPDTGNNLQFLILSNTATEMVVVGDASVLAVPGGAYQVVDYHIQPGSPAEDAGTADGAPDHDFEYDTRPVGAGFDIGVDEILTANPVVHSVQVVSGLEVDVRFSQAMGLGVTTPSNYAVSGSGKGTLSDNPATVTHQGGSTYRLYWPSDSGQEMVEGGDITITVSGVFSAGGDPLGTPDSGTHTGGGMGLAPVSSASPPGGYYQSSQSVTLSCDAGGGASCQAIHYTWTDPRRPAALLFIPFPWSSIPTRP